MNEKKQAGQALDPQALFILLSQTRALIRYQQQLGITEYPVSSELRAVLEKKETKATRHHPDAPKTKLPARPADRLIKAPPPPSLAGLQEEISACRRCPRHQQRVNRPIKGRGPDKAPLLIVAGTAELPNDADSSSAFDGKAGELLDRMLAAIGMNREMVYLTTLLKCPAQTRSLGESSKDADRCLPFLELEIAAIAPQVICSLGQLASQKLLKTNKPVSELRGRFHNYRGIPLMPTFDPAFLLKNPEIKKLSWIDLQMVQKKIPLGSQRKSKA